MRRRCHNYPRPPARVPRGGHQLSPLPYPYDALEPVLSREAMRIHHQMHHADYVRGLNRAELALVGARERGDWRLVRYWERELAFHGSGDLLHTLYWRNMTPDPVRLPVFIRRVLTRDFGGPDQFRAHFLAASELVAGNGWGIWVWQQQYDRSEILAAERHENMVRWATIPLLVVDVWEHAHYLDYPGRRRDYLQAWWALIDWNRVQSRLERAAVE